MKQDRPLTRMELYEKSVSDFEAKQFDAKKTDMKSRNESSLLDKIKSILPSREENGMMACSRLVDKVTSISFKKVCFCMLGVIVIIVGAFFYGIGRDDAVAKKADGTNPAVSISKGAVKGNHLSGLPRDYTEGAGWQTADEKKGSLPVTLEVQEPPEVSELLEEETPAVPVNEVRINDTYAERYRQYEEDLRLKAKESPIAFELKEGR